MLGIVINNAGYSGGNDGGPEKAQAMADIRGEAAEHSWRIFSNQLPYSRGYPKMMRGNYSWLGNARASFYALERELRRTLSEEGYLP